MNGVDPAFKLFGSKIPVPEPHIHAGDTSSEVTNPETETSHTNKSDEPYNSIAVQNDKEECQTSVKSKAIQINSPKDENPETNSADQEKVFKKPDKVLPCPRCNSLDTKFCYFNNYNVNQPRHFCKNCHRYWTAGGTMRNVPIGAGRRKNKHLTSQYRHIIVSPDGAPMTHVETPDSVDQQLLSPGESTKAFRPSFGNGTVLKFDAEAPLCESMEAVLSLGDQKKCVENGTVSCVEIQDEPSSCISSSTPCSIPGNALPGNLTKKEYQQQQNTQHRQQCYPVLPWIIPFNSVPNNVASVAAGHCFEERISASSSNTSNAVQWCPTPMVSVPGFCPSNIPLQFVPAYWGCMPVWAAPGGGNVSSSVSNGCLSPSSLTSNSCCSSNGSPTLGKHSREANFVEEEQLENCVLVPKTLRIDDPNEALRSPIWDTLGIKPQQKDLSQGGKIFNAFESKAEGNGHLLDGSHILEANPAALSRSHTFQEST